MGVGLLGVRGPSLLELTGYKWRCQTSNGQFPVIPRPTDGGTVDVLRFGRKVQVGQGTGGAPSDFVGLPSIESRARGRTMTSSESLHVAAQLDEHHCPETNGRIAVCRRCGARTDGPRGLHHVLQEGGVSRSSDWLTAQSRLRDIANAKLLRGR